MSDVRLNKKKKTVMLPELVRQLFWLFWSAGIESGLKIQMFLGCLPRLYLRQLYLKMTNNVISNGCIIVGKGNKSCLLPSERGGVASVGASTFGADVMIKT